MSGLTSVRRFKVPTTVVERTMAFLAAVGAKGYEGLVLWVGHVTNDDAVVEGSIVPAQTPLRTETGLAIYVGADALHDLGVWLYEHKLRLLAQVHSHGEDAYHSETDNHCSVITTIGGVSIVVPYFACHPFTLHTCSVHRLTRDGWVDVPYSAAMPLIQVED